MERAWIVLYEQLVWLRRQVGMQLRELRSGAQQLQRWHLARVDPIVVELFEELASEEHRYPHCLGGANEPHRGVEHGLHTRVHRRRPIEVRQYDVDDDDRGARSEADVAPKTGRLVVRFSRSSLC